MSSPAIAREAAIQVVRTLHERGHVAYFAGGCVRDDVLGQTPKDYDVATDAEPDVVKGLFRNTQLVGEAFGVVLVRLKGHTIEVATFRTEWGYVDGRRPTHVQFTDAEHDAQRRDFTVNALYENPLAESDDDRIIDYVGGLADLDAKLIRAVGDANERFGEDYLRLLRAVRFATRLGFALDEQTAKAIGQHADKLGQISRERIGQEVELMLASPTGRTQAVKLLQQLHLDGPVLTEPPSDPGTATVSALSEQAEYPCVLTAWMLDRHVFAEPGGDVQRLGQFLGEGAANVLRRWRRALCLSNDQRDAAGAILEQLPSALDWQSLGVAPRKRLLARDCWSQLHQLLVALGHCAAVATLREQIDSDAEPLFAEGVAPPPFVNGDDLINSGRKPGPAFSRLLDQVYDAQLEGRVHNRPQALQWLEQVG